VKIAKWRDEDIETIVSVLLRTGVVAAGAIVLAGGVLFLVRHGNEPALHSNFHGQPAMDCHVRGIFAGVRELRARSVIQLGVLVLIATPIARVAFSLVGFALERDRTYVVVTLIVLCVLMYSLMSGAVQG
jgi:uncharacterized membrane protein